MLTQDTKLNISPAYMKPGFAYGGSCLPKDLRALLFAARTHDLELPMLQSLSVSNSLQIKRAVDMALAQKKRNVAVLGFSFKAGTDDLRESPTVELIETLLGKGCQLRLYDKNVSWAKLMGANKQYIETVIPHISDLMVETLEEAVRDSEVLIIGNNSPEFAALLSEPLDKVVIDLVRVPGLTAEWLQQMEGRYHGICW
jgi:GDP-mannose 6-dehydrogenase